MERRACAACRSALPPETNELDRVITLLARLLGAISAALVAVVLILVTASAVMRYLLSEPFRFTEELVGLMVLASIFLALPLIWIEDRDIRVTALVGLLPKRLARLVFACAQVIVLLFLGLFGWDVWKQFKFSLEHNLATEVARLPIWPWVAVMLAALAIVALITVLKWLPKGNSRP